MHQWQKFGENQSIDTGDIVEIIYKKTAGNLFNVV